MISIVIPSSLFLVDLLIMVLSLAYLLTELDSKVRCHTDQLEEIDCRVDKMEAQAVSIEGKLDEDIDLFIDQLMQRKEALKETLWQIVVREGEQLAKKKAEILEHVKVLKGLENMAFQDSTKFRELYGNAVEKSGEFDVGVNDIVDLKLSADHHKVTKSIVEFGTISYNVCEKEECEIMLDSKSNDGSIHQSHCPEDGFDVVNMEEASPPDVDEKSASDVLPCELYGSCNCLDVCEDTGIKITEGQVESKEIDSSWEQWLCHPKEPLSSDGDDFIFDNKIASQLETLHLSQIEQAAESEQQHVYTTQVSDNLQCWLASKQRSLNANTDKVDTDNSAVGKVWDEIKARGLLTWLKPEVKPGSSVEEKGRADRNADLFDSKQFSEKGLWLKGSTQKHEPVDSGLVMELKVADKVKSSTNLAQYEAVKSTALGDWLKVPHSTIGKDEAGNPKLNNGITKDEGADYGVWLKRKLGESVEEPESETTKVYKRIRSTPLESWLKIPKSREIEMELRGAKSISVDKVHDITCAPLEMWLKRMSISSDVEQNKYGEWLVSKSKVQKKEPCHTTKSMVLRQFDEIAASSLHGWIKKANRMPKPACHDLCKWLKNGPLEGCKTCCLASRHNSDLLL